MALLSFSAGGKGIPERHRLRRQLSCIVRVRHFRRRGCLNARPLPWLPHIYGVWMAMVRMRCLRLPPGELAACVRPLMLGCPRATLWRWADGSHPHRRITWFTQGKVFSRRLLSICGLCRPLSHCAQVACGWGSASLVCALFRSTRSRSRSLSVCMLRLQQRWLPPRAPPLRCPLWLHA